MNFDRINKAPCIIPEVPPVDPRCDDAEFALANPGLCSAQFSLIIRPSQSLFCIGDSIQFRVFEYRDGVETELTEDVAFESSNQSVFVVGVNSGSGSAMGAGVATITATHDGASVVARLEVNSGTGDACCNDLTVATAIAIDDSRSMSLGFGLGYASRLQFARAVASEYASNLISVAGTNKDTFKIWSFNSDAIEETDDFTNDETELSDAIAGVEQTQQKTDLLDLISTATDDLLLQEAHRRVLVIVSDGEHSIDSNRQAVIDAATTLKSAGGIIIVVGARSSGAGFDLLQRVASIGYFLNTTPDNIDETFASVNLAKSLTCSGKCVDGGDEYVNQPDLEYAGFLNWQLLQGQVNLIGPGLLDLIPGHGLYVDMAAGSKAILRSIDTFNLLSGRNYRISFSAAGNQRLSVAGQGLKVYVREATANDSDPNIFEQAIFPAWDDGFQSYGFVFPMLFNATVRIFFEQLGTEANPSCGNLLDNVLFQDFSTLTTLLDDDFDSENLTFIPPACGPSSEIDPIEEPAEPTADAFDLPDADMWNGDEYSYAISYLTPEGETDLSPVLVVDTSLAVASDKGTRVSFAAPPANVIAVRIWRTIEDGGTDLWLLASLNPEHYTSYDDIETHADFLARYDSSIVPPTANTTGKAAGELGIGYADCCYYWDVTVDDTAITTAVPVMTSNTEPSGEASSNTGNAPELAFYAFDNNPDTLYSGFGELNTGTGVYAVPVYLQYEFAAAKEILRYSMEWTGTLFFGFDASVMPKAWEFQGSNNGSSWDVLDSQSDVSDWADGVAKQFDIGSPASYKYYRLSVIETNYLGHDGGGGTFYGWHYLSALKMFSTVANTVTEFENNCPECASSIGEQVQDSTPLPDIESDYVPPTIYTSTKSYCKSCGSGKVNLSTTPVDWSYADSDLGPPLLAEVVLNDGPKTLAYYRIGGWTNGYISDFEFQGSNDGSAWTTLDSHEGLVFYAGEYKSFLLSGNGPYRYYRLYVTNHAFLSLTVPFILFATPTQGGSFFEAAPSQVCASATETSTVSQADADKKARDAAQAAAEAQVNCVDVYTATESALAKCPLGSYGNQVTKSATRQSLVSQDDAVQLAQAAALALAQAELVCTLSNNEERIIIYDAASAASKADPYPSVKYVSGLFGLITKVTVSIFGLSHNSPDDVGLVLRSPSGTLVHIMGNCGGIPPGSTGTANVDLVIDDDAGSDLPDSSPLVSGTFRPKVYVGSVQFPELPAPPYGVALSDFIGEDPNGSWALFCIDDLTTFDGEIAGGWDIDITTA